MGDNNEQYSAAIAGCEATAKDNGHALDVWYHVPVRDLRRDGVGCPAGSGVALARRWRGARAGVPGGGLEGRAGDLE